MSTRILLADPDVAVLDGLAKSLELFGFDVEAASDRHTCIQQLCEFAPSVWVLEPDVKDNWGWQLLSNEKLQRPPTLIVSRFTEDEKNRQLYEKWLMKPVSTLVLVTEIQRHRQA